MQGPEQGLVGESRSDRKQGHAEDAKQPGERAVGEIAQLAELHRHIAGRLMEVRLEEVCPCNWFRFLKTARLRGQIAELEQLQEKLYDIAEKRSDLSNAERIHGGAGQSNQPETTTPLDGADCSSSSKL